MLKIDYALVPLSDSDRERVDAEVRQRILDGRLPEVARTQRGRMVLLNPDPVQTVHQVPDELRPRLRRVMVPAQEGSTHLRAERLFHAITESEEQLYLLVMELESEFRALVPFLDYLPRLRQMYPGLGVFLSGSTPHLLEKLRQLLADERIRLRLHCTGHDEPVEIGSAEEIEQRFSLSEQVVPFSTPFFSQLRLQLGPNRKPMAFNIASLRQLHPVFGHGEPVEIELGKGRRERMLVLDLPLAVIRDIQFRTDRGPEFYGVTRNGHAIRSTHFADEKLEYRWVPLRSLEAFLRRPPGGELESVALDDIGWLRVNCLTGEVAFVMHKPTDRISAESIRAVTVCVERPPKRNPMEIEPEGTVEEIAFDRVIRPTHMNTGHDPMHEAVRETFYGGLIRDEIEKGRKTEVYAQRLRVGAIGPLAGQTLKLLRRFGLEELIHPDGFFYLCDSPEDIPDFSRQPERMEQHFGSLVELLTTVAGNEPSEHVRVNDIAYNLPISTEWVDTGMASYGQASAEDLEAVYQEMNMLLQFIGHEFQRTYDSQTPADVDFFQHMSDCRSAGLLAKWMAEVKREAYGRGLPEGTYPDIVFYGTEADKRDNDRRFFYPSVACAELLESEETRGLFQEADYDFSVFLEEQLALGIHELREQGVIPPELDKLRGYFERRADEQAATRMELQQHLEAFDRQDSATYQDLLRQEEETYRARYKAFQTDRERTREELEKIGERYVRNLSQLKPLLEEIDPSSRHAFAESEGSAAAREQRILRAARMGRDRLLEGIQAHLEELRGDYARWLEAMQRVPQSFAHLLRHHGTWQRAMELRHSAELESGWDARYAQRLEALAPYKPEERQGQMERVAAQLRDLEHEQAQLSVRLSEQRQRSGQSVRTVAERLTAADARLKALADPALGERPEDALKQAEGLGRELAQLGRKVIALSQHAEALVEHVERGRARQARDAKRQAELRVDAAVLQHLAQPDAAPAARPTPARRPAEKQVQQHHGQWQEAREQLRQAPPHVQRGETQSAERARLLRGSAAQFRRFQARYEELARLTSRQWRLREALRGLNERQQRMQEELKDLPSRVQQTFMPARRQLLSDVFIPEAENRERYFRHGRNLLVELLQLPRERLRALYLDRAIHRRFRSAQFMTGWVFSNDPASPRLQTLRNIHPALLQLVQAMRATFIANGRSEARLPDLQHLPHASAAEIRTRVETLAAQRAVPNVTYMVLPATLDVQEAVALLNEKDALFQGVPRLVGVYVSKFERRLLLSDPDFREAYFRALKHNVIVNIDGVEIVDNPRDIAAHLLQETLGSAVDIDHMEVPAAAWEKSAEGGAAD